MTRLADLPTPALILDREIMDRNIVRMAEVAARLGAPLRPHGKTPKSISVAKRVLARGGIGLTVSTLREAEHYHAGGVSDLFYAVALAPAKAPRVGWLLTQGAKVTSLVDHREAVGPIGAHATDAGVTIPLAIEIDVDGYRAGIRPGEAVALASHIDATPGTAFAGIMSYGGASYGLEPESAASLAEDHRRTLVATRKALAEAGLPCTLVSFGSSPATLHARSMEGITELRCGIYVFQDLFQAAIGACAVDDVALSVLATVIGVREDLNRIIVDAGGMAMSKDLSTARTAHDAGYGLVCDERGVLLGDVYMPATSQELGLLSTRSGSPLPFERLRIGSLVRILPNHADMTAAAYPGYHVVAGDDKVVDFWERANGW